MKALTFLFLFSLLLSANPDDVNRAQWRGASRDGHYDEENLLKEWPADGPQLLWSNEELDAGYSSISPTKDRLFITGTKNQKDFLIALDRTGKIEWRTEIGKTHPGDYPLARCTPTVRDGKVYAISGGGTILCANAATGEKIWSVEAFEKFGGRIGNWGVSENLLIEEGQVYYTPAGNKTTLVALNAETGETVWQSKSLQDQSAYSSPILVHYGGKKMVVNLTAKFLFGVEVETGKLLWHYEYGSLEAPPIAWGAPYVNTNTPLYHDGQIYVTSGYDHAGAMFKISDDASSVSVVWTDKTLDTHHGGVVLVDGYIYGSNWINNRTGNWCSIDWKTGKPTYETKWNTKGSIVYADGMLYAYEERRGNLALVKATPEGFEPVSTFQIKLGEGPHWSHPVIYQGILYVRHGKVLMAYDIKG